jgi:coproporphyrinogen III oxidase-like Fe-S oxidoreductase
LYERLSAYDFAIKDFLWVFFQKKSIKDNGNSLNKLVNVVEVIHVASRFLSKNVFQSTAICRYARVFAYWGKVTGRHLAP